MSRVQNARTGERWYCSSFALSLGSGLLLWAALPPLGLWPLGWVAPVFWLILIRTPAMPGRRPYVGVWAGAALHWLAVMQGVRLAHWALYFGWIALACYLAAYVVLFVGLTRVAVHRWRAPLLLAAPVVWTGLELARGHVITGFSMALLAHSQVRRTALIQLADAFGAYGVSFVLMLFAAGLAQMLPPASRRDGPQRAWSAWPLAPAVVAIALAMLYGKWRLREGGVVGDASRVAHAALVQGSFDTVFDGDIQRHIEAFEQYLDLSLDARESRPHLDLIVWPESMFAAPFGELIVEGAIEPPPGMDIEPSQFRQAVLAQNAGFRQRAKSVAESVNTLRERGLRKRLNICLIVGTDTTHISPAGTKHYNSALLINPRGEIAHRYYKMHPVMFGEYLPFGAAAPWLYRLTPMKEGLTAGDGPRLFEVGGLKMSPSICFESTVPHLIRRQVAELTRRGASPDVLVNITNDGWFWGSGILDLHLQCAVFRAIENRRPVLIAANTGLSAWIDGNGGVRDVGPRRAPRVLYAAVRPDGRGGLYQTLGDLPAGLCLLFCAAMAVSGLTGRFRPAAAAVRR